MAPTRMYKVCNLVPEEVSKELEGYHGTLIQLLYNRGIVSKEDAQVFLNPDYEKHLHDPFLLTDMEVGVKRILDAIANDEHIVIYSDYDCDGIPGGVTLHDFFEAIGFANFENYIPHRHHEGYGFNKDAVEKIAENKTSLIITIDCGIVDHEATAAAQSKNIDVIITDHHEPGDSLPNAYAIINPKRDDAYPFKGLCGSGVVYKLIQGMLQRGKERGLIELKDGWEKWWLDMVGLATIADRVPLTGENRVLARYGLQVLRKSRRPGLQHLLQKAGGSQKHITEDDIGFVIAPRINAASRMDNPEDAFNMLRTKDEAEAGEYVRHLEKLNNERKGVVAAMTKEAKKKLKLLEEIPNVLVLGNPNWRPSLVGLVANALSEEYRRPVFVWGRDGRGILKGSCRSNAETSALDLMEKAKEAFIEFGGHHASGGFSVEDEMIHTLGERLNNAHTKLDRDDTPTSYNMFVDVEMDLGDLDQAIIKLLRDLAPFGEANPKPLFRFTKVTPKEVSVFGKTKNHTKIVLGNNSVVKEAIAFFKTPEEFQTTPDTAKEMSLIAHIETSFFMGRQQTRLRIVDVI